MTQQTAAKLNEGAPFVPCRGKAIVGIVGVGKEAQVSLRGLR